MVVGCEIPFYGTYLVWEVNGQQTKRQTLGNLLALVDLSNLLVKKLVTLLANLDNLLALQAQSCTGLLDRMSRRIEGTERTADGFKHLVRDLGRGLVLCQSIRVVEGVV